MQTIWQGNTIPSSNLIWEEAMVPFSVWVVLPETANVPREVRLPAGTQGVRLWPVQDMVWYGMDADPGPIPPPTAASPVQATDFVYGGCAMPGQWLQLAIPQPELAHAVHLRSTVENALVLVEALTEGT
jgi:hypothetical protein